MLAIDCTTSVWVLLDASVLAYVCVYVWGGHAFPSAPTVSGRPVHFELAARTLGRQEQSWDPLLLGCLPGFCAARSSWVV